MYVLVDSFNYDGIIESLRKLIGEDQPLTTDSIAECIQKVLNWQAERAPKDPFEHLVNCFLTSLRTEALELLDDELLSDIHDSVYIELNMSKHRFSTLTGILVKQFGFSQEEGQWCLNGDIKKINAFILTAREEATKLSGVIQDTDERIIYSELIGQLTDLELLGNYKFTVLSKTGKMVKYGNDLITFPVILAEVFK